MKRIFGYIVVLLMVLVAFTSISSTGDDPVFVNAKYLGWELLKDNTVIHAWNQYNDYYFNNSNGIQFTNHYEEYWTKNVLMLGYYDGNEWNPIYRTDELSGFNRDFEGETDGFMNLTLWKDLSYSGYNFRLALRYHLGVDDSDLTIIPYIKNLGIEIPFVLGFGWEMKDIQIDNNVENDQIRINKTSYLLNQSLDEKYTNTSGELYLEQINDPLPAQYLYLKWNPELNYLVWVKSRSGQYNAPTTLFIRVGTLNVGQEKHTEMHWLDGESVSLNNPIEDGYISEWTDSSLHRYKSYTYMKIGEGATNHQTHRGYFEWNISSIPDGATITDTIFKYDGYLHNIDCHIHAMASSPSGASDATLWADMADGTVYVDEAGFPVVGNNQQIDLGTTADSDLQSMLTSDWFAIGIQGDVEDGTTTSGIEPEEDAQATPNPTLYVEYTEAPANVAPTITGEIPANQSTGISTTPQLNVTVDDSDDDYLNVTWRSNSSGAWVDFNYNSSLPGGSLPTNISQINSNFSSYSTLYYWSVNVSDGTTWTNETFHFTTEAEPWSNTAPTLTNEVPSNTSSDISRYPQLNVTVTDVDGNSSTVYWYTNASGSWYLLQTNNSVLNATVRLMNFTNASSYSTMYYWKVSANDTHDNTTETYHFTTIADTTDPSLTFNFVGNLYDEGGPMYIPPHSGDWDGVVAAEGFYTNMSHQKETWMIINATVTDNGVIDKVMVHLLNETTWDNTTWEMTNSDGDYYECNVTGLGDYNYSFDIRANDTADNNVSYEWEKQYCGTNDYTTLTRSFVRMAGTPVDFNYTIMYLHEGRYGNGKLKPDGFRHDQGSDSSIGYDTGLFNEMLPVDSSTEEYIYCSNYIGAWLDKTMTINKTDFDNVYLHLWWNSSDGDLDNVGLGFTKDYLLGSRINQTYSSNMSQAKSSISTEVASVNRTWYLECKKYSVIDYPFNVTDNSLYQVVIGFESVTSPYLVSNLSIMSFVIPNVPDNATLTGLDTDNDNLNDYEELFVTYTNPFLTDTDNDGMNDYWEYRNGSDPNNWTDSNNVPTITGEIPVNQSTGISLTPICNITVNDADNDLMTVYFYENTTGDWVLQQTNNSVSNGNVIWNNYSNSSSYSTTYHWSINVSDGTDYVNETYHFTTESAPDSTPPTVVINFAGNLSDSGGPYWRPPGESVQLTGVWSGGYYTNDSRQHEDWIYINLTVNDTESAVTNVWLQWLNETSWTNWTYAFANTDGDYWEYNTSGNIQTYAGYNYSFDIVANSSGGSNTTWWNKTGLGGIYTRRYVQLNCTPENITYTPFYFYGVTLESGDYSKYDRLHHDQGGGGSVEDTGYLLSAIPTDAVNLRRCASYVSGGWFDNNSCVESYTLDNIYYHFWWSSAEDALSKVGWDKTRIWYGNTFTDYYATNSSNNRSYIYYDNGLVYSDDYFLETSLFDVTNTNFTDNDIYELFISMQGDAPGYNPSLISNRSFTSFVIPNVPDDIWDGTDNSTDTDGDGLSDHMELNTTYGTHTNPFLADTDNDGVSDYNEYLSGSDPNNYTDTIPIADFDVEVSPSTWNHGNADVNTNIQENFTFYQNGSATLDITIGMNATNYTFVSYANWLSLGHDRYCANYTTDNWVSETNIVPGYPPTSVLKSGFSPGNFGFGVRIYMPRTVTYINKREDFEITLIVSESS